MYYTRQHTHIDTSSSSSPSAVVILDAQMDGSMDHNVQKRVTSGKKVRRERHPYVLSRAKLSVFTNTSVLITLTLNKTKRCGALTAQILPRVQAAHSRPCEKILERAAGYSSPAAAGASRQLKPPRWSCRPDARNIWRPNAACVKMTGVRTFRGISPVLHES